MELLIALSAFGLLAIWLILRAKPRKIATHALDPSEANMTLDLLLEEAEKTNELLRQLIRLNGHEPEA
jgi:hypothetical protein